MTVYRSRLIIRLAAAALALLPGVASAQMDTGFSNFVIHAPVLAAPIVSTDTIPVVRDGHTYQTSISPFTLDPVFDTLTVTGAGGTLTINPANQITSPFTFLMTAAGTVASTPTDTAQMALVWLKQTGDLHGVGLNRSIGMFEADYNDTGTTNNNDSFTGVTGNCNLLNTRVGNGKQTACIGVVGGVRAFASQGGTLGAEQGELHAMNIVAGLSNILGYTPTNFFDIIGAEVNITGCTGCTQRIRIGLNVIDFGNGGSGDSEQGSTTDAAFGIASVGGTKGWRYAMNLAGGPTYAGNALDPTNGIVIGSDATSPTLAAQGIDLNNFVISGNAFRSPAGGLVVTGAGKLKNTAVSTSTGSITGSVCMDVNKELIYKVGANCI